jgi:hypothetical protein
MTAAVRPTERAVAPARLVVIRQAPRREPPFDDELPEGHRPGRFDQRLPFARPATPVVPRLPFALRGRSLPDPGPWGHRLLVILIESAGGRRPLSQLATLLSYSVLRGIGADFERNAQAGTPHWLHRAGVRSVRATEPSAGVAELCATVQTGERVRAVAMRLEARDGRWRCTRLQLG